jgi:GntR family transcriptional regulator of vanillate catabolism
MTDPVQGHGTSTQAVATALRERILEGAYPPGAVLRQDALAQALGVSRTPLRTALAELARDGLVTYEANRGYAVRAFDLDDVRAAFEVRATLEALACRRAAERGLAPAALARLDACLATGDAILGKGRLDPADLPDYRRMNVEFHETIIGAGGNPWVGEFVARTHNVPLASDRVILWDDHAIILRSHDDHHRIRHALAAGDGYRAERQMWEHVTRAGEILVTRIAGRGGILAPRLAAKAS